jgi:hypothetical protein
VQLKVVGDAGETVHSEVVFGGGLVMVNGLQGKADQYPYRRTPSQVGGGNTQNMMVFVDDVDAHCARARKAGATIASDWRRTIRATSIGPTGATSALTPAARAMTGAASSARAGDAATVSVQVHVSQQDAFEVFTQARGELAAAPLHAGGSRAARALHAPGREGAV